MTTDLEEQEDELLALQSIFDSEEFIRNESKSAGQIRVFVELPGGFTVSLKGGERLRQYEISHLPPLVLTFELPQNYPSSSPPSFTLTCSWLTHTQVKSLVGEQLFSRYDRLLLQSTLDCMPDVVYCPRRSCGSAVILEKSSTAAMCSVCDFAFCVTCRKTYHGTDDCQAKEETKKTEEYSEQGRLAMPQSAEGLKALQDDYASGSKERRRLLEARYSRRVLVHPVEETLSDCWMANNSKNCPHCFSRIHKDGGCNVMTCSKCGQQFCWACLKRLSGSSAKHFKPGRCRLFEYIY